MLITMMGFVSLRLSELKRLSELNSSIQAQLEKAELEEAELEELEALKDFDMEGAGDGRTHSLPYKKYGPYTCPKCKRVFTTSQHFAAHMGSHYKYETKAQRKKRLLAKYGLTKYLEMVKPRKKKNNYALMMMLTNPNYENKYKMMRKRAKLLIRKQVGKDGYGFEARHGVNHVMSGLEFSLCYAYSIGTTGGMGFRDFNLALLAKQGWRLLTCESGLVGKIFKARYFANGNFLRESLGNNPSYIWRVYWNPKLWLRRGLRSVGSGSQVNILHDPWLVDDANPYVESRQDCLVGKMVNALMKVSAEWDDEVLKDVLIEKDQEKVWKIPLIDDDDATIEKMRKDIELNQDNALNLCTEKVLLAQQAYDLIDSHVKRLDEDLTHFAEDLKQERDWDRDRDRDFELMPPPGSHKKDFATPVDAEQPIDPNEPTYCVCHQVSFGDMIACDNENHLTADNTVVPA
uniref:C2H2-type domain-containing protein n=1 Tax=Cannabis sativa TaxID=3483 RepID=A0A803PX49_CANSA